MQCLFSSNGSNPPETESVSDSNGSVITPAIDISAELRSRADRPWIYTNMVTSADGGTAVEGLSGGLGSKSDKAVFRALRSVADVILVGAGTARAENYRAPTSIPESSADRELRGQAPHPRLAIVTRSLHLSLDLPLFNNEANQPIIFTSSSAPIEAREALSERADVVVVGEDDVDIVQAVDYLTDLGTKTVLCEGGPSLNGQLIAADLVDEWNLSISPLLLGSDSKRAAVGQASSSPPGGMQLARVWLGDDVLFCRWIRKINDPDTSS